MTGPRPPRTFVPSEGCSPVCQDAGTDGCSRRDEETVAVNMCGAGPDEPAPRDPPPPRMLLYPRGVVARNNWTRWQRGDNPWSSRNAAVTRTFRTMKGDTIESHMGERNGQIVLT